ncbi:DUF4424 family protein [Candidatus Methylospira mobilis]|nr:DUF4424 family protein [Candidatus Methylospira mobilis]WNV06517.1 DUF4424 family protein [Candidatus Methylospira mobilis]
MLLITIPLLATGFAARANDSTARVGAGGITLLKNDNIRMLQETLMISTKAVRVRYRFINEVNREIQTTVAFPMPAYVWNPGISALEANVGPLKSFQLRVDGRTVSTQLNRKALIGEQDVTNRLRELGLSDAQIFETFGDCTIDGCSLTRKQLDLIAELAGANTPPPPWSVAATAFWEQAFPAQKEIEIEHEYQPFAGVVFNAPYQVFNGKVTEDPRKIITPWGKDPNEACLDEGTRKALTKRIKSLVKKGAVSVWVTLNDIEYVLGTGRNWKGPINDFTLQIEKESPDQLVSLCFPGKPKKINPTLVEFSHSSFMPQDKLVIYFYTVTAQNQ